MSEKKSARKTNPKRWQGGIRRLGVVGAVVLALFGTFVGYSYADDTVPDFFDDPGGAIVATFMNLTGQSRALNEPSWTVDPSTATGWIRDDSGVSTDTGSWNSKTTGRVWTDKTVWEGDATLNNVTGSSDPIVIENDDPNSALVSLSALSSAASITGTEVVTQPLDIVLVLDASSYMDAGTDVVTYEKIDDQVVNSGVLHLLGYQCAILNDAGEYESIVYVDGAWHVGDADGETVDLSAQPIYQRITTETTKLDVLKDSANEFVESVAHMNENLDDTVKHHLSVVQFGAQESEDNTYTDSGTGELTSSTKVLQGLTVVDDTTKGTFTSAINGVQAEGNSSAIDLGMQQAQNVINQGGRGDAKKIVIVFTAGSPRHSWDQTISDMQIADPALEVAASLKDENGTDADIYTVGFFEAADSSVTTTWPNNLLQGISSNYPDAKVDGEAINLGGRDQTHDYYFNANSAEGLQSVFEALTQAIENNGKTPLEDEQVGGTTTPGYIEFTDTLGDFMEVKDFKSVVYAGTEFTNVGSKDNGDGTVTYTFTGTTTGNHVYTAGDLSDIQITVSKSDTAKTGDVVTVRIPASLIPLRYYQAEVNKDSVSTDFSEADAYPIRVFYTVGVKDEVLKSLDTPEDIDGLSDVISDDKATFITNQYASGSNGTTTAEFTPAKDNGFYYFNDENGTVIYSSPDLNPDSRVTEGTLDKSKTYYYALEWFDKSGTWHTDAMQISPNSPVLDKLIEQEGGYLAVPMGTERYSRAQDFESPKTENKTQTATNAISPAWGEDGTVTVSLGNNGKVTHTVPGNLDISKTVDWGNGTPNADALFTFKVDIAGEDTVVPGDFTYTIYEGEGTDNPVEGGAGTIKDGGTIQLKHGQHVVIEDIPGGLTYTVTETVPAGFTTNHTETTDEETKVTTSAAGGTITSKQTSDVDFINTYTLQEVTLEGDPNLKVTKTIDGRAWAEGDKFDFTLTPNMGDETTSQAVADGAIKFGDAAATADSKLETSVEYADAEGASGSDFFGDITFTKPGTYQFVVQEVVPSDAENNVKDGITYTTDKKTVTVTVKDNGDGTMTPTVSGDALAFTNTYKATGKLENVAGTKTITGRDFKKGDSFTFNVTGSATALDGDTFTGTVPMPNNTNTVTINPESGTTADVAFGTITFTQEGVYTYTFKEQAPEGAAEDNDWTVNGITYDVAEKTIVVKVEDVDHNGTFKVTVTTPDNGNVASALAWNNTYKASPNTGVVGGAKTLTGRDWLENETYNFKLEPNNDTTVAAVKDGKIDGFTVEGDTIEPLQLKTPVSANGAFNFSELTFKETGDYQFKITEVMPGGASADNKWTVNGVTYDSHTAIVNVKVTDPGDGKLKVEVTPSTEEGQENAFTNSYEVAPLDYALNLSGTKTVDDQVGTYELKANAFKFVLTPDAAAYPLPTGEGVTRVDKNDASKGVYVTNKAPEGTADEAAFQLAGTITFTKGGTYTYTLTEDKTPQPGITFDQSVYHIAVTVEEDPATGTLEVTGVSVTKGDGDEAITDGMSKLDFTNTYSAGSVEGTISATKNLSGRNFKPEDLGGDAFTFAVKVSGTDAGGAAMTAAQLPKPANTQVTEGDGFYSYTYALTVTSDGTGDSGTTTFNPVSLTYTRPGTYTFEISENAPTDKNITKDDTVYTVTVVVEGQTGQDGEPVLAVASTTVKAGDSAAENGVVFNNAYTATGAQSVEITKQLSNRAWDDDDEFTFTLKAFDDSTKTAVKDRTVVLPGVENPTDGDEPATITITKADGVEDVYAKSFGDITFNKTGTYKFLVQEQVPEGAQNDVYQGVSYDADPRLVTITVSHDYQGGFEIEQKVTTQDGNGDASLAFNNSYDASDAKLDDLAVTKTLTGRNWLQGDKFDFELAVDADKDTEGVTTAAIEKGDIDLPGSDSNATATLTVDVASTQVGDDTTSKTATFGDITFKTEGTFYFKLTEAAHSITGVSHDNSVKYIKVVVEDDGDGQLIATPTVTDGNGDAATLTFTNTYTAKGFTTSFDVQKTFPAAAWNDATDEWTGRDWTDNDTFEYTLTLKSGDADGVQIANEGTSELGKPQSGTVGSGKLANVTFTKAGEYTFEVTETKPDQAAGVAYDTHTATITVQVEHDYANGTFKIAEGYPQYANTNAAAGDIATTDAAAFTNVYEPTTDTATLSVKKVLTGRDWDADDSFTFTLAANDTTTEDAIDAGKIVLPQDATNGITVTDETEEYTDSFGAITFKAPGDYQFKITETVPEKTDGITYPTSSSIVNVNVRDSGEGKLVATVAEGEQTTTVTNMYGASGSLDGGIKVSKTLTGRDNDEWLSTDSFTFSIAPENDVAKQAVEKQLIVLPNDVTINAQTADHTAEFGKISFGDVEDGTYTFTVTENAVAADSGIAPGGQSYTVAIRVTDESGDGTLKVELLNEAGDAAVAERTLAFTNTYKATGTLADGSITVEKVLTGRDWTGSDSFEFKLTPKSDNAQAAVKDGSIELPKNATDGVAVTSENNHQASFGAITFDDVADGDYVFTVTETSKSGDGITYAAAQDVTITVEDNDAGTLTLTPATTNLTFTNTYQAEGSFEGVSVTKSLTGRDWQDGDSFEFQIALAEDEFTQKSADKITLPGNVKISSADSLTATFGAIKFGDVPNGDYKFVVSEVEPKENKVAGVDYSNQTYEITLSVTDQNNGTLEVTVADTSATKLDSALSFTNTYKATGKLPAETISATKDLTGRAWQDGDTFQFKIKLDETGLDEGVADTITVPADPIEVTNSTADRKAAFGEIEFNDTPDGEYTFIVSEVVPDDENKIGGITYSTAEQTVKVKVTDDGQGGLDVTLADGQSGELTFENSYAASGELPAGTISVTKNFTGRPNDEWVDTDSFTFTIAAGDEKTRDAITAGDIALPEGASDTGITITDETAGHKASFGAITFGDVENGDYTFTVTEQKVEGNGIKYAEPQNVTVTVTDNNDGTLKIEPKDESNNLTFTNTYTATSVAQTLSVEKVVTGADAPEDFEFALTLSNSNQGPADGVSGLENNTVTIDDATLQLSGDAEQVSETASFNELTFSKEGTYTFDVTEKTDDYDNGWTYDNDAAKTVTVTVEDNDEGALKVTGVQYDDGDAVGADTDTAATFTNQYTAGKLVVNNLTVTKKVEGNATNEAFNFELKLTSNNGEYVTGLSNNGTLTASTSGSFDATTNQPAEQKVTFPALTFTEPGDYTFTVTETNTAPADTSWTYDNVPKTITVKVRDNGNGQLVADGSVEGSGIIDNNPTIVNRYSATGDATITVEKIIQNREWLEDKSDTQEYEGDSFEFTLTATGNTADAVANGNVVMPTGDDAKATITSDTESHQYAFGAITFKVPGTYTFNVTEQGQSHDGLTYDTDPKQVTIDVTDNGDGTLTAAVRDDATNGVARGVVTITNTYATTGAEEVVETAEFKLTKELVDTPWNGQSFSFTIAPQGNAPVPEKTTASVSKPDETNGTTAAFDFGTITFNAVGDYTYVIAEDKVEGDYKNGIHYDTTPVTITVHVTDDLHGGFNHTFTVDGGGDATFTNTYGTELDFAAAGGVEIVKNMNGADISAGEFQFTVTPTGDNTAETAALLGLKEGETSKLISTKGATADLNDEGAAVATEVLDIIDTAAFTHTHDGDTYQFTVAETTGGDEDHGYDNDGTVYLVTISVDDNASGELKATTTVAVQTADADHPHQNGTYVYSNVNGSPNGTAQVVFDNTYHAEGSVTITGHKTLNNAQLTGNEFGFTMYDAGNNPVATARNDASGNISFTLNYTIDQLNDDLANHICTSPVVGGKDVYTYQYKVTEDTPLPEGMTANKGADGVTVEVTNNGDGTLGTKVTYDSGDQLQFENTYGTVADGSASLNVGGTKKLVVNSTGDKVPTLASIADQYTFTLSGVEVGGTGMRAPGDGLTATNTATGDVDFGDIVYTIENVWGDEATTDAGDSASAADDATDVTGDASAAGAQLSDGDAESANGEVEPRIAPRTKTFQYTVSEKGGVAGITNGKAQVFFVTVTDNLDGTVSVKCTSGNTGSSIELTPGDQFTITNEYNADPVGPTNPTGTGELTITKTLDNRPMNKGEFSFTMAADQKYEGMTGATSITATNGAANGDNQANVAFTDGFTFTKVGKYNFTISENDPDLGGIIHDTSVYYATADVTDNGQGQLVVDWAVTDADGNEVTEITFENQYVIEQSASVVFGATKALAGKDLAEGQFTFELKDADGNVIQTATNTADGSVVFAEPVEYWGAGEYTYTISEVNDGQANVTYDDTVYTATVTVTDNLDGTLTAAVSYGLDGAFPAFENVYTEPLALGGTGGTPQTGDPISMVLPAVLAAGGVALIAAALAYRRLARRRDEDR